MRAAQLRHVLPVATIGFASMFSQTIVFRDFLRTFHGNELSSGAFFSSWLLWVAVGAGLGRLFKRLSGLLPVLVFSYVPAFLLQHLLFANSNLITGASVYELPSLTRTFLFAFVANAPVSLCSGALFVLAAQWLEGVLPLSVGAAYAIEGLGGFCGGLLAACLFGLHFSDGTGAAVLVCAVSLTALLTGVLHASYRSGRRPPGRTEWLVGLVLGFTGLVAAVPIGLRLDRSIAVGDFHSLLPGATLRGRFSTANAVYHHGEYGGDFSIVAWGQVIDNLPDRLAARQAVAQHLAQHPAARRVLLIGSGLLATAAEMVQIEDMQRLVWISDDPSYSSLAVDAGRAWLGDAGTRIETPEADARQWAEANPEACDMAILAVGPPDTVLASRYYTPATLAALGEALAPDGVLAVAIPAGENYMGEGIAGLGASVLASLRTEFSHLALKPGEQSCFYASNEVGNVTDDPATIEQRLRILQSRGLNVAAEAAYSFFPLLRTDWQLAEYETLLEQRQLQGRNRLAELTLLRWMLLVHADRLGPEHTSFHSLRQATAAVWWLILVLGAGFAMVPRCLGSAVSGGTYRRLAGVSCVALAGFGGITVQILLLVRLQAKIGNIYVLIGLVSSLFMLGVFAAGVLVRRLPGCATRLPVPTGAVAGGFAAAVSCAAAFLPLPGTYAFCLMFLMNGLAFGMFFQVAAHVDGVDGGKTLAAASRLDMADHFGGVAGSLLTGTLLLPILGAYRVALLAVLLSVAAGSALVYSGPRRQR